MFSKQFILSGGNAETNRAQAMVLDAVEQCAYDKASSFAIRLALEEALSNAFKHGNQSDPSRTVRMRCEVDPETVLIDIHDEGAGFDPGSVPDPTKDENLENPSGRGLMLMRAFMTEVIIHPPGNRVEMIYRKSVGGAGTGDSA